MTLAKVFADLREEFSSNPATAAKGTRDIVRDVSLFGLADVVPGYPEVVTENLRPGTYYLMDLAKFTGVGQPEIIRLFVTGNDRGSSLHASVHVTTTSADRFIGPRSWPHRGTYLFHNAADTIHFMAVAPVKAGTTDKQIQAFFDSHSQSPPPFFRNGPSGGNDVVARKDPLGVLQPAARHLRAALLRRRRRDRHAARGDGHARGHPLDLTRRVGATRPGRPYPGCLLGHLRCGGWPPRSAGSWSHSRQRPPRRPPRGSARLPPDGRGVGAGPAVGAAGDRGRDPPGRRRPPAGRRGRRAVIFALAARRALEPASKLAATRWVAERGFHRGLPGVLRRRRLHRTGAGTPELGGSV